MRAARERERIDLVEKGRALETSSAGLPRLQRVYVFGSAARRGRFTWASDLDIAFEGLPPEIICETFAEVARRLDRDVDAVRIEDASPLLRARILKGEVAYECGPAHHP